MIAGCSAEDSLRVTLANWQQAPVEPVVVPAHP